MPNGVPKISKKEVPSAPAAEAVVLALGHVRITLHPTPRDFATLRTLLKFYERYLSQPPGGGGFKCDKCGKVLPSSRGLKLHIARRHRR